MNQFELYLNAAKGFSISFGLVLQMALPFILPILLCLASVKLRNRKAGWIRFVFVAHAISLLVKAAFPYMFMPKGPFGVDFMFRFPMAMVWLPMMAAWIEFLFFCAIIRLAGRYRWLFTGSFPAEPRSDTESPLPEALPDVPSSTEDLPNS